MPGLKLIALVFVAAYPIAAGPAVAEPLNRVLGTWRMVSAQIDPDGKNLPAYGPAPNSLLVFTADMHVVEVPYSRRHPRRYRALRATVFRSSAAAPRSVARRPCRSARRASSSRILSSILARSLDFRVWSRGESRCAATSARLKPRPRARLMKTRISSARSS
jgi:hypothetical protein